MHLIGASTLGDGHLISAFVFLSTTVSCCQLRNPPQNTQCPVQYALYDTCVLSHNIAKCSHHLPPYQVYPPLQSKLRIEQRKMQLEKELAAVLAQAHEAGFEINFSDTFEMPVQRKSAEMLPTYLSPLQRT